MRFRNIYLALKGQLPLRKLYYNFFVTGNGWGLFSINSHINKRTGKKKIMYPTLADARKAAGSLSQKTGGKVSAYKCIFCDGYHIGHDR